MKKSVSFALAAAIAVSAIGVTATEASAKNRGDRAAVAMFGAIAGLALSQAYQQHYYYGGYPYAYPPPPPPQYPYYSGTYYGGPYYPKPYYRPYYKKSYMGGMNSAHVQWCLSRYRTYNPATNTYFRKPGVPAVCYSPYG